MSDITAALEEAKSVPAQALPRFDRAAVRSWLLLAVIVAVGLSLRCYQVASRSLWFDEAFTFRVSQFPPGELLTRAGQDNHPPLHFLVLKGWTAVFGTSLLAMRSLSVLCGTLTIVGAYLMTVEASCGASADAALSRALARRNGLWVAALIALAAAQIRWSWDVRMYALGTALTTFSSWSLFRALHAQERRYLPWVLYAALALSLAYTHYFGVFTVVAQGLFVVGYLLVQTRGIVRQLIREPRFRRAVLAGMLVLVGWLPWLPTFLHQRNQVQASFWNQEVSPQSIRDNGYRMFVVPERASPAGPVAGTIAALCAALCLGAPLVLLWQPRTLEWYVAAAALVPIFISAVASTAVHAPIFHSRYFLFAHLFILASIGLLVGQIASPRLRRTTGGAILIVLAGLHLNFVHRLDLNHSPGSQGLAAYVEGRRQSGESVVVASPMLYLPLRYHAAEADGWYQWEFERVHWQGWSAILPGDVIDRHQLGALGGQRMWVVEMSPPSPCCPHIPVPSQWVETQRTYFGDTYGLNRGMVAIEYENVADRSDGESSHSMVNAH